MNVFLSKSDFKVAQTCATKLYYRKNNYPTATQENDYLSMLADGGFMVGKMARLLYENGIEILTNEGTEKAIIETEKYLQQENIILFEAAININNKLIRVDILEKRGNSYKIIEVKSKSFDSKKYQLDKICGKKYFELPNWQEHIEDIAFQKYVLQEKFPAAKIEAFLLLPDKAKTTSIEGLIDWFKLSKTESNNGKTIFKKTEVIFTGDLKQLREDHILEYVNVDTYVDKKLQQIKTSSELFVTSLIEKEKLAVPIEIKCSKCEFTSVNSEFPKSGFQQCWKELANVKPHLFELAQLGNFNRAKDHPISELIKQKKVSLYDVPVNIIQEKYNNRAYYQVTKKEEFLLSDFVGEMGKIEYPIHFIDFETSQMAIPYHAGMRPYGKVIFQWSCHTIEKPGALPKHKAWLNTDDKFPNFKFAESLKDAIGDVGSIMIWSLYENSMLKDIFKSFETMNYTNQNLKDWLLRTIRFSEVDDTRLIDMNKLALMYYFHPTMGGRTSIKVTLPAVLKASQSNKIKGYLSEVGLLKLDENESILDPYKLLPVLELEGTILDVNNGTGAMIAYQEMLYGANKNNVAIKEFYKNGLLEYCKLDTLAMVIIWEHWNDIITGKAKISNII